MDKLKIFCPVVTKVTDAHTITGTAILVNGQFVPAKVFPKDEDVMMTNIIMLGQVLTYCIQFPLYYEDIKGNLCLATFNSVKVSELSEICIDADFDDFSYELGTLVANVENKQIHVSLSIEITYNSFIEKIIEVKRKKD